MNGNGLDELREAYEMSPDNPILQKMYYSALKDAERWSDAETLLEEMIKQDSDNFEYQVELGKLLYRCGKISKGILVLESLLSSGRVNAVAYECLIKLYVAEENRTEALNYYNLLVDQFPNHDTFELDELLHIDNSYEELDDDEEDDGRIRVTVNSHKSAPIIPMEDPEVNFEDVGGMQSVKDDIAMKIINPIKHADLFKQYGKSIGGGILLYGPPGCGKTHIARATAGEIDAAFFSIGINDVLNMYLGESENQLHDIFEHARSKTPCVLFFDEVDALGANRNDMRGSAGRNVVNQFLHELDGANKQNDGLLVLGATNAPWYIDSAFKRPGRFDRIIFIPPPDEAARVEILKILLKDKPKVEAKIEQVASKAKNFTGADLKALVDLVVEQKLLTIMQTGKETPFTTKDFTKAMKMVKCSSVDWFETAKNYAMYSNQGGQYDDILDYLKIKR